MEQQPPVYLPLTDMIKIAEGQIASRSLKKKLPETVAATLYGMAAGETISPENAVGQELIQVLEGKLQVVVVEEHFEVVSGQWLLIPDGALHSLRALTDTKYIQQTL